MSDREFKVQTLRALNQWNAGVHSRLRVDSTGVQLFNAPDFDRLLPLRNLSDIAVSAQGELFWAEQDHGVWYLLRAHNSGCGTERVLSLSSCNVVDPRRLWWTHRHVWVLDAASSRMLGFDTKSFQITREIDVPGTLIDADLFTGSNSETVYALVSAGKEFEVRIYPAAPGLDSTIKSPLLGHPVAIAVSSDGSAVILDTLLDRFVRLHCGSICALNEHRQPELRCSEPVVMETDPSGAIYVASGDGHLRIFDPEGSFLVEVKLPSSVKSISGMGFDAIGNFYLASNAGVGVFTLSRVATGVPGSFYSPVLDNGKLQGTWHGVSLLGKLPAKSGIEVAYYAFDDEGFKALYTQALTSPGAGASRIALIESRMALPEDEARTQPFRSPRPPTRWVNETGKFAGSGTAPTNDEPFNMAFVTNTGRYLVMRIRITAYDAASHPSLTQVQVLYPRISLLRYLPPVYQEDPVSSAFVERLLSLFETVFQEVDIQISDLYQYFDPATTPPQFLTWLASWLNLPIDANLPDDRKRALIAEAPELLRTKGTAASISRFLELFTGASVEVTEPSLAAVPFIPGQVRLGEGSILARQHGGAVRIGDDIVLGETVLVPTTARPEAPLAAIANRFEISVGMDPSFFAARKTAIERALRDFVPANTDWTLRLSPSDSAIGSMRLGINARVAANEPFRVGYTALGSARALGPRLGRDLPAPRLERGASVTPDWRLIE